MNEIEKYVRKSNAHTLLYGASDMVIVYLVSCKGKLQYRVCSR